MKTFRVQARVIASESWLTHVEAETRQEAVDHVREQGPRNFMLEDFTVYFDEVAEVKDSERNHERF